MSNIVILGPWIVILSCFILSLPCHRAWQTRPVHSPTILMHSGIGLAEQLRQRGIAVMVDAKPKSGSIADNCLGAHMSGGLSHRRPKIIVDQVPPESIRAAAHDIACRASEVHALAVGTCAIN